MTIRWDAEGLVKGAKIIDDVKPAFLDKCTAEFGAVLGDKAWGTDDAGTAFWRAFGETELHARFAYASHADLMEQGEDKLARTARDYVETHQANRELIDSIDDLLED